MFDRLKDRVENLLKICTITRMRGQDGQLQNAQIKTLRNIEEAKKLAQFGFNSKPPVGTRGVSLRIGNENIIVANEHQASIIDVSSGNTVVYNQDGTYIKLVDGTIESRCIDHIANATNYTVNTTNYTVNTTGYTINAQTSSSTSTNFNVNSDTMTHNNVDIGDSHRHLQNDGNDSGGGVLTDSPTTS